MSSGYEVTVCHALHYAQHHMRSGEKELQTECND